MHQDTRPVKASNQAQKRKAEALRQKLFTFGRRRVSYESVKATALVGHIGQVSSPNKVYSLKRSFICAQTMVSSFAMPPSKAANSDRGTLAPMEIETGDDKLDIDSDIVHFRILPINLANKKRLKVAPGAGGGPLSKLSIPITLHSHHGNGTDGPLVSSTPITASATSIDPVLLLDPMRMDVAQLEDNWIQFSETHGQWIFRDVHHSRDDCEFMDAASALMAANAYQTPDGHCTGPGCIIREELAEKFTFLEACGILVSFDGAANLQRVAYLTSLGREKLSTALECSKSSLLASVRPELALEDRTDYELIKMLEADGRWQWQPWRPAKTRANMNPPLPDAYFPDGPRVWYSSNTSRGWYLRALLSSQDPRSPELSGNCHYYRFANPEEFGRKC